MRPKKLTELQFWVNFFSHTTVIVQEVRPELLTAAAEAAPWKGVSGDEVGTDSFSAAWANLGAEKRAAVESLAAAGSNALLNPCPQSAPAFPTVPAGIEVFIDEAAATAAFRLVSGLQKKHYALVPRKLSERSFWVNFFTHAATKMSS